MNNKIEIDAAVSPRVGKSLKAKARYSIACRVLAVGLAMVMAEPMLPGYGAAFAQRIVQMVSPKRTALISVQMGKTEDVRTDASFIELVVADPDIADVSPLTDRTISILGRKSGTTRVSAYSEGKRLVGVFDIEVTYDVSLLQATLDRRFLGARIRASSVNGRIVLAGAVNDAPTVDKAMGLARQFGDVINLMTVNSPQQVMLEVRFIEANRQAGRELGVQWNPTASNGRFLGNIGARTDPNRLPITPTNATPGADAWKQPGQVNGGPNVKPGDLPISQIVAAGVLSGTAPFGFLIGKLITNGLSVDVLINALEAKGMARALAEPNLTALSGETASFLAGGEFPVPVPGGPYGQITIDYKKYGVGLAFTPTVLGDGLINLKIEPEVSQLDTSNPVQVAGVSVPPLIVRRASTTVELRDGQSFVIGGLLQSQGETAQQQLPWLGDVPVLGALFRSAAYKKKETDLAIIVTPRLVRPARPGDKIATPLDNTLPPNDVDFFLMGKPEVPRAVEKLQNGVVRAYTGHVLEAKPRQNVVVEKEVGHVLSVKY